MNYILVIPEGIKFYNSKAPDISNTYKAVLDLAIEESQKKSSKIVLLPANNFNTKNYEQNYAKKYLLSKNFDSKLILLGKSEVKKYIDTKGNFELALKNGFYNENSENSEYINYEIKKGNYTLSVSHLHVDRTLLVIKAMNFNKPKKIIVSYASESPKICKRLFYYRWPELRMLYETMAIYKTKFETFFGFKIFCKLQNLFR